MQNPSEFYIALTAAGPGGRACGIIEGAYDLGVLGMKAALVVSATLGPDNEPTLTPTEVQAMLCLSADDLVYTNVYTGAGIGTEEAGPGRDIFTGWGRINAGAAVALAVSQRFKIRNGDGQHLASFDIDGDFIVEGVGIWEQGSVTPDSGTQEFIVKHGSTVVALVDDVGNYRSKGRLYEELTADLDNLDGNHILIRHGAETVAVITSEPFTESDIELVSPYTVPAGSVLLRGSFFAGGDPDPDAS